MSARILVVEDDVPSAKLMEGRLSSEYFEVHIATSGDEALVLLETTRFDLIILDVVMPYLDGFEVCRRIKSDPRTSFIPVVMVTALHQTMDRVFGLEAGADDFLIKPVRDIPLLARVKSLIRLKMLADEVQLRAETYRMLGFDNRPSLLQDLCETPPGRVLLIEDRQEDSEEFSEILAGENVLTIVQDPQTALSCLASEDFELVLIDLHHQGLDSLRLCSQIRSTERTRTLPIVVIAQEDNDRRLVRAFDIGVNDYVTRPFEPSEFVARVRTQIRRKRYVDRLRETVQQTIEYAVTDGLTGLHNRRYLEAHLRNQLVEARDKGKDLSLAVIDIDYFKAVNDTYGHDIGDEVLREVAARVRCHVRGLDLAARLGGEEFVVVMPDTDKGAAEVVAERVRLKVGDEPISVAGRADIVLSVTCSIGIASLMAEDTSLHALLRRADLALYAAKRNGRNRVVSEAA